MDSLTIHIDASASERDQNDVTTEGSAPHADGVDADAAADDRSDIPTTRPDGACDGAHCREIRAVHTVGEGAFVVRADGTTRYWGGWEFGSGYFTRIGRGPTIPPGAMVATTRYIACAVWDDFSLRCWGSGYGGLGRGDGVDGVRMQVAASPLLTDVHQLGLFGSRRCAVNGHAEMFCWGAGDTSADEWPFPVPQPLPPAFARFARDQGGASVCYHAVDGGVRCRGINFQAMGGACITRPTAEYVEVPALRNSRSVALSTTGGCAVLADATVSCWAYDNADFDVAPPSGCYQHPVAIPGLADVRDVGFGVAHGCALTGDGRVLCFGRNRVGKLGRGVADDDGMHSAAPVTGLPPVTQLAVGSNHNCALTRDHRVFCWGFNYLSNAAGGPNLGPQPTPTEVVFTD
jgi:hypothetical protein